MYKFCWRSSISSTVWCVYRQIFPLQSSMLTSVVLQNEIRKHTWPEYYKFDAPPKVERAHLGMPINMHVKRFDARKLTAKC